MYLTLSTVGGPSFISNILLHPMWHAVWGIMAFESSHVVIWQVPDFQPVVRDRVMNRTFAIISPQFTIFSKDDWVYWFHLILTPLLPSFSPRMLKNATANINCTNYHVVWVAFQVQARLHCKKCKMLIVDSITMFISHVCSVSGMAKASPALPLQRQKEITEVLLDYLTNSASVINKPGRADAVNCAMWLLVCASPWTLYCEKVCWTGSEKKIDNWLLSCVSMQNNAC